MNKDVIAATLATITQEQWQALLEASEAGIFTQMKLAKEENRKENSVNSSNPKEDLDLKIRSLIKQMGVPQNILGYNYLIKAIALSYEDEKYMRHIVKKLYPEISKEFDTTPGRAERAIRHAIERAFATENELHKTLFGEKIPGVERKPTNSHFIATIVEYLKHYM